ncbi:MAG: thioredoxin-disulfide reductase [Clostridiales bacterium]|nr:thioredoxin-disulfide reductase [Candidatus Blautia equi]
MSELFDLTILGAGPAGVGAAVYAARAGLKTIWIDRKFEAGGQIVDTYEIDNYPGLPGISGIELAEKLADHAEKLGMVPERDFIRSIEKTEEGFLLRSKKKEYRSKTVILSGGASHRHLDIPGEEEFSGMGVSYCATCDGAFFKGKTTVVIGGGNTAVEDAIFLSRVCEQVYLVHRRDTLRADRVLQEKLKECENVEVLWSQSPVEIHGEEDHVTGITLKSVKSGILQIVDVDGVFIAVGIVPNTELLEGFVKLDKNGYVEAGEDCVTSTPGIFAAGDIRTKKLRQVVTAVADGANAVTSVQEYLL